MLLAGNVRYVRIQVLAMAHRIAKHYAADQTLHHPPRGGNPNQGLQYSFCHTCISKLQRFAFSPRFINSRPIEFKLSDCSINPFWWANPSSNSFYMSETSPPGMILICVGNPFLTIDSNLLKCRPVTAFLLFAVLMAEIRPEASPLHY